MKKRNEIEEKYKWDLNDYFESIQDFEKEIEYLKSQINVFDRFKGKLKDKKTVLECLTLSEELGKRIEVLCVYVGLRSKEDTANSYFQEKSTQIGSILSELSTNSTFIGVEIKKLSNKLLKEMQKTSQFPNYFKDMLRNKKHILSEKEEKILTMSGEMAGGFSSNFNLFDNADLKFLAVKDSQGKKKPLNHSTYAQYLQSEDRLLRKNAFKTYHATYGAFNNFLSSNYIHNIKTNVFYTRTSKYKSCLDKSIYLEEASREVYDQLIKSVNENLSVFYEYFDVKRRSQELDKFYVYDQFVKEKAVDKKYTFEEAIDIIKEATRPLGEEYTELLEKAVADRWIDVFPNLNKDSGAFSWGAYGKHPVVLTNFIGDTKSLFTLAHELGHCLHSFYSNANNSPDSADYTIFVAEVASIVNEILLLKYLQNKADSDEEKIYYFDHFLNEFKSTVFRQTMFSEFEQFAHETFEKGEPISAVVLNGYYYKLNQKYFGGKVKLTPEIKFEWSRIPHFFRPFYVYKYAIGMISAIYIVENVIFNQVEKYINFLKSGSRKSPIELLLDAGVDLKNKETFNNAFNAVKETLKQWKKLI